jgi:hypothetical protein
MVDLALRRWIYTSLADTGRAPTRAHVTGRLGSRDAADLALRELHDAHMVVLDDDGEVAMALPFASRPTDHRVVAGDDAWWANCAWDSLAIPVALDRDATIEADWIDTGDPVDLAVRDRRLVGDTAGFIHFQVPARHWWDDIVET